MSDDEKNVEFGGWVLPKTLTTPLPLDPALTALFAAQCSVVRRSQREGSAPTDRFYSGGPAKRGQSGRLGAAAGSKRAAAEAGTIVRRKAIYEEMHPETCACGNLQPDVLPGPGTENAVTPC